MEIIYKNDTEEEITENIEMPKNFRQIGSPVGKSKLYIEDYVSTYLKQLQKEPAYGTDSAVLLGEIKNTEQGICVFVSAAVPIEKTENEEEKAAKTSANTCFQEDQFTKIYQVMKEYFTDIQIVGWVQMVSSLQMQITPKIAKTHRQFFPGKGKVFWMLNLIDKEEKVYLYQKGELSDLHGYYIYYEKNQQMQEYMVRQKEKDQKTAPKEIVDDLVTKNYRQRMTQAKPDSEKRGLQLALYAASAGVMAAVCILGVSMLNNYESMKQMQNAIAVISNNIAGPEEETDPDTGEKELEKEQEKKGEDGVDNAADKEPAADTAGAQNKGETPPSDKSDETAQDVPAAVTEGSDKTADDPAEAAESSDKAAQGAAAESSKGASEGQPAAESSKGASEGQPAAESSEGASEGQPAGGASNEQAQGAAAPAGDAAEAQTTAAEPVDEVQTWLDQGYYIVQAGENLETICLKIYKTTAMLDKLCEANNIQNVDIIYAGQKLVLP